jgi:hypothetical protein
MFYGASCVGPDFKDGQGTNPLFHDPPGQIRWRENRKEEIMDGWVSFGGASPSPSPSVQSKDDDDELPPPPVGPLLFAQPSHLHLLPRPLSQTWLTPPMPSWFLRTLRISFRDGNSSSQWGTTHCPKESIRYDPPIHFREPVLCLLKVALNAKRVEHRRRLMLHLPSHGDGQRAIELYTGALDQCPPGPGTKLPGSGEAGIRARRSSALIASLTLHGSRNAANSGGGIAQVPTHAAPRFS